MIVFEACNKYGGIDSQKTEPFSLNYRRICMIHRPCLPDQIPVFIRVDSAPTADYEQKTRKLIFV